jgi:hypothetical protein
VLSAPFLVSVGFATVVSVNGGCQDLIELFVFHVFLSHGSGFWINGLFLTNNQSIQAASSET